MQWIGLPSSTFEKICETKEYYAQLIVFVCLFVCYSQDCILIIEILVFPKILCNPKLRWQFRRKCRCELTFIFVLENVTWHFGFEVEREMNFVKATHCLGPHKHVSSWAWRLWAHVGGEEIEGHVRSAGMLRSWREHGWGSEGVGLLLIDRSLARKDLEIGM